MPPPAWCCGLRARRRRSPSRTSFDGVAAAPLAGGAPLSAGDLLTIRIRRLQNLHDGRGGEASGIEEAARCPLLDRDPQAWLRCCTARFLPMARRIAGDDETAHHALQDSWILVLEKLYQYRGAPPACGWVGTIVRHEAGHRAARKNRAAFLAPVHVERVADALSPEEALQRRQLLRMLPEAIDQLPPTYREVVLLRDVDERPVAEVARKLHIS